MLRAVICFVKDLYTVPEGRSHVEGGTAKLSTVGTVVLCILTQSLSLFSILSDITPCVPQYVIVVCIQLCSRSVDSQSGKNDAKRRI